VTATSGTGVGQMLPVTSSSSSDGNTTLSLGGDWSVLPDSESELLVQTTLYNTVFYYNSITYDSAYGPNLTGSAGIQLSGGYGIVVDDNTIGDSSNSQSGGLAGILLSDYQFEAIDGSYPPYAPSMNFIQVINNTDTYSAAAGIEIRQNNTATLAQENTSLLGTIISGNYVYGVTPGFTGYSFVPGQGISLGWAGTPFNNDTELIVIENNDIDDCAYDIGNYDEAASSPWF
jgi:hypothetical protein